MRMIEDCDNHLMKWEKIEQDNSAGRHTYRCKVIGGWIVRFITGSANTNKIDHMFIDDKSHVWGNSDKDKK